MKPVEIEILMKGNLGRGLDDARRKAESLDSVLKRVGATVGIAFGTREAVEFARKIMDVRGEVESLQISFETLAGKTKGQKLFGDIRDFAVSTPMMMQDLAKGAQTLLGFNIEAEKVMPILRQIGDISMGDAQKFNSLTLAFAQMSSTGKLMGQDLLQMINAGFNPLVVISEKTGKSMAALKKEMSEGRITVKMVEDAFAAATAEGGRFHGMLEKQSKGIKGAMSNLQGAWEDMLNDIGEKSQGVMVNAINQATELVKDYDKVLDVLEEIVVAYGSYKAALMLVVAAQKAMALAENIRLVMMFRKEMGLLTAAQQAFNRAALVNPYVLIGVAAAGAGVAIYKMAAADDAAEAAQKKLNQTMEDANQLAKDHQRELDELTRKATSEAASTDDRRTAMQQLVDKYPSIIQKYIDEKGHLTDIINLKREIARLDGQEKAGQLEEQTRKAKRYLELYDKSRKGIQLSDGERKLLNNLADEVWDQQSWWTQTKSGSRRNFVADYYQGMLPSLERSSARTKTENMLREYNNGLEKMTDAELEKMSQDAQNALKKIGDRNSAYLDSYTNDFLTRGDLAERLGVIGSILDKRHPANTTTTTTKTDKKDTLKEQREQEANAIEEERRWQEKISAIKRDAADAQRDAEIAAIRDDGEREHAEQEEQHKRNLRQIEEQANEMKKAIYEHNKTVWENSHKDSPYVLTPEGKDGWRAIQLSQDQQSIFTSQIKKEDAEYERHVKKSEDKLIRSHQSYIDKKKEIDKNYQETLNQIDEAITNAESRGDQERVNELTRTRAQAAKDYAKEQARAALDELQDSPLYTEAFDDLSKASTTAIQQLIQDFEKVKGAIKTPTELREFQNTLNQLYDELAERDPIGVLTNSLKEMGDASEELKKAEERLDAVKNGKKVIKKVTVTKDKQVVEEFWEEKDAVEAVTNALKNYSAAKSRVDKAIDAMQSKVAKFADAFKQLGNAIGGTEGEVISLIGETLDFVNTVVDGIQQISKISEVTDQTIKAIQKTAEASAEGVKTASKAAVVAISAMEKASIILTIISAAIQLAQQISELLPDKYDQYKQFSDKVNEINRATQAVRDYTTAVIKARQEEENWFSTTGLKGLADQFELSSKARDDYYDALLRPQAIYENESGGGWLAKLGGYASQTIGKWSDAVNDFLGIEDTFLGHAMGEMAKFGWANLAGGPIGQSMYWENYIWKKGWDEAYKEGMVAAWQNLRIETRSASSGFLGTGIGGHSQKTEDLVEYVRKNLGLELFDEKGMIDLKVYEQVMEKYGDKLVGDTEETLKELAELKEAYDEYQKKLGEYISELYSPLSDAMVDALWDFYSKGTDVMDAFKGYSVDVFKNIGKEITKTLVNSLTFDKFKERLEQIYTKYSNWKSLGMPEELSLNMLTSELFYATDDFLDTAEKQLPILQQAVDRLQNGLAERGLLSEDVNGSDQTAKAGGFAAMSQDQGTKLDGMFTAGLQHWSSMDNELATVGDNIGKALDRLKRIEENTEYCRKLEEIAENIRAIKNNGVKVK